MKEYAIQQVFEVYDFETHKTIETSKQLKQEFETLEAAEAEAAMLDIEELHRPKYYPQNYFIYYRPIKIGTTIK